MLGVEDTYGSAVVSCLSQGCGHEGREGEDGEAHVV